MSQSNLTGTVDKALTELIAKAEKTADPVRLKIVGIKADIAELDDGDMAIPALRQAIESLEVAETSAADAAKAALGDLIVERCKEHGIALGPIKVGNGKKPGKRLSAAQKEAAAAKLVSGIEGGNGVSRGDAAKIAGVLPEQATTILKSLVADGKFVIEGTGKNTTYKKK